MRPLSAAFVCLALLTQQADAAERRDVTLTLPRALQSGESAFAEVRLGLLARGLEIEVTTAAGRTLGVISPYGIRAGQEAGTYTLPIPSDAIVNRQVALRLFLNQFGHNQRAPTAQEVKSVRLKISPAARDTSCRRVGSKFGIALQRAAVSKPPTLSEGRLGKPPSLKSLGSFTLRYSSSSFCETRKT